jgi:hypothetical protein
LVLEVSGLLDQEFLVAFLIFVFAYLVGSVLRLFAADDVDRESSRYLEEAWRKLPEAEGADKEKYEEYKTMLEEGGDGSGVPDELDEWLWRVDEFPYPAWQNRKWQVHGPKEVLDFFSDYKASLWSGKDTSPKSFFNYCKLVALKEGGLIAAEIDLAEGLTRFFAGTVVALKTSMWLMAVFLFFQAVFAAVLGFVGIPGVQWDPAMQSFQVFFFGLTVVLVTALWWIRRQIVIRFRTVRLGEVDKVYYAFYLVSKGSDDKHESSEAKKGGGWRRFLK